MGNSGNKDGAVTSKLQHMLLFCFEANTRINTSLQDCSHIIITFRFSALLSAS